MFLSHCSSSLFCSVNCSSTPQFQISWVWFCNLFLNPLCYLYRLINQIFFEIDRVKGFLLCGRNWNYPSFSSWFYVHIYIYEMSLGILDQDRKLTKPCPFFWRVLKQWVSFSLRFGFVLTSSKERGTELEWRRLNQPMNKPKDKCNFKFIFDIF